MIIKLFSILLLSYGLLAYGQVGNNSSPGFESIDKLKEFFNESWKHYTGKGNTNPKYLTRITDNCLLSVDIVSDVSIKLTFVDKETVKKVYDNRQNIDIENIPKGLLCRDMTSDTKVVSIGEKFLFDSDGHHISTSLKLLEINKNQVVFEYSTRSFMGFASYSSNETGILNLELD